MPPYLLTALINFTHHRLPSLVKTAGVATLIALPSLAQATISDADIAQFASNMTVAANSKDINRVSALVADDALISVSRKGKTSTLNKATYLNLLQNNWSKATQYRYSITVDNVVNMGTQAKADVVTTELLTEQGITTQLVTTSRATLSEAGQGRNHVVLSRAISQLAIEQQR